MRFKHHIPTFEYPILNRQFHSLVTIDYGRMSEYNKSIISLSKHEVQVKFTENKHYPCWNGYNETNHRTNLVMKELWDSTSLRNLAVWKSTEQRSHVFVRCQAPYFVASGGQSGWLDGWAARNAGWFSSSRSIRKMMGNGRKSTWNLCSNNHIRLHTQRFITHQSKSICVSYLRALNTCGMRQQSAIDISSPTQYLPAHADNSFSTAG